jgi:hypothetical protein
MLDFAAWRLDLRDMRVRLTRKLADSLDGIDVSAYNEGDVVDLPRSQARLLMAEKWARPVERRRSSSRMNRAVAADAPSRLRTVEQLRRVREQMEQKRLAHHERRRAEDRIREELRESRARVVKVGNEHG